VTVARDRVASKMAFIVWVLSELRLPNLVETASSPSRLERHHARCVFVTYHHGIGMAIGSGNSDALCSKAQRSSFDQASRVCH
jgi:hypothetical protein